MRARASKTGPAAEKALRSWGKYSAFVVPQFPFLKKKKEYHGESELIIESESYYLVVQVNLIFFPKTLPYFIIVLSRFKGKVKRICVSGTGV